MATKKDDNVVVELTLDRDTPGTHVFKSADKAEAVTSLYVRKGAFPKGPPKKVRLTVEPMAE